MNNKITVEINLRTIIKTLGVLISLYFLYYIRDILLFIFIGILVMSALNPLVSRLERWKLNRTLSIVIVYILLITVLGVSIAAIVPPLISQVIGLINQIPIPPNFMHLLQSLQLSLQDFQVIANQLTSVPKLLTLVTTAFSGVLVFVSLIVLSFYLLIERVHLPVYIHQFVKTKNQADELFHFINKIETQIGGWVRAESALMLVVGVLTFVGLTLLQVNYSLALAILAGLLEILPNLGPIMAAVPAIAVAYFTVSPGLALAVAVLYVIVQELENHLVVPFIMRRVVGISPVITIVLLLIGFRMGGVVGAAIIIPIFLVFQVVIMELKKFQDKWQSA